MIAVSQADVAPALAEEPAAGPAGWLGLQLRRLERLVDLQQAHCEQLNPQGRRLLSHAIFVTYVDCRELGGEALAARLIAAGPAADRRPEPGAPAGA